MRKRINIDLKLLVHWLHANKIGLNVDKTEAILFRSAKKKVDYDLKLKLNGKKLQLVSPVRYLGIVLGGNLSWTHHKNSLAINSESQVVHYPSYAIISQEQQ